MAKGGSRPEEVVLQPLVLVALSPSVGQFNAVVWDCVVGQESSGHVFSLMVVEARITTEMTIGTPTVTVAEVTAVIIVR